MKDPRPIVYIIAPFAACDGRTEQQNVIRAVALGSLALSRGCIPFVPHVAISCPALSLPDADRIARETGLDLVSALGRLAEEAPDVLGHAWIIERDDGTLSPGSALEVERGRFKVQRRTWADWRPFFEADDLMALYDAATKGEPFARWPGDPVQLPDEAGRFFAIDESGSVEIFDTDDEAREEAQKMLESARDEAQRDEWSDDVTRIGWGILVESVQMRSRSLDPDRFDDPEEGEHVEYDLVPYRAHPGYPLLPAPVALGDCDGARPVGIEHRVEVGGRDSDEDRESVRFVAPALVVAPAHYHGTACWDWIEKRLQEFMAGAYLWTLNTSQHTPEERAPHCFNLGNALKYVWRAGAKPGNTEDQDLAKARQYVRRVLPQSTSARIDRVIEEMQADADERKAQLTMQAREPSP